jgi:peptidoglycan/LPS O-acetylase OafA/YrhL
LFTFASVFKDKKNMQIKNISNEYSMMYKGIGILLIVFHNFFHLISPGTGENEWDFSVTRLMNFYNGLGDSPFECINLFFSFFGHYGVQIFIFISGVGLALSMQNRDRSWGLFVVERLKKLYPLMITGFVFFFFYEIILSGKFLGWYHYREFLYKMLFLHTFNITKGSALSLSGPWWFFGLIFQLYIIFPLLFKVIEKYRIRAFISICFISYVWMYISQYVYQPQAYIRLLQNAPGHLPEFALGILIAISPDKKIHYFWGILSLIVFSLGNYYKLFFPFTFLSVTVLLFWGSSKILPFLLNKTKKIKTVLLFYGSISMILFVIHGPLRGPFIAISGGTFYGRLLGATLFLLAATALSILGNMLYRWLVKRFDAINKIVH